MSEIELAMMSTLVFTLVMLIGTYLDLRQARKERDALLSRKALREAEELMGSPRIVVIDGVPMGEL